MFLGDVVLDVQEKNNEDVMISLTVAEKVDEIVFHSMGMALLNAQVFNGTGAYIPRIYIDRDGQPMDRGDTIPFLEGYRNVGGDCSEKDGVLFSKDGKTLIAFPHGKICDRYYIPEGTEKIEEAAFSGARVRKIVMPDSVRTLCSQAFLDCDAEEIVLSRGLVSIGAFCKDAQTISSQLSFSVFGGAKIKRLVIPSSVKLIGMFSFFGCKNLTDVVFEEGGSCVIEDCAFACCPISDVSLPKSCKRVEKNAFPSTLREMTAYSGTRGVAGSIDSSYFVNTNIPTTFTLIKDDGTKQRLCVPAEVRKKGLVCTAIDIAFCRGNIPCSIAELVFNVMTDVSPRARKEAVYNKSKAALIAVMEYGTEDEHIRKFLKTSAPYFAERLISGSDTKTLSELLSLHVLSPASLERLLALASSSGEVESAALISEEIRRKSGRAKTALKI